jgi:hypothetical protein
MAEEVKYGYYSPLAAEQFGTHIYTTPDGRMVEITAYGPEDMNYYWDDKVCVGVVCDYVRQGTAGQLQLRLKDYK